mgnify:FL=1
MFALLVEKQQRTTGSCSLVVSAGMLSSGVIVANLKKASLLLNLISPIQLPHNLSL